jgi:hypothetical protein
VSVARFVSRRGGVMIGRDVLDALIAVCMLLGALLAVSGTLELCGSRTCSPGFMPRPSPRCSGQC